MENRQPIKRDWTEYSVENWAGRLDDYVSINEQGKIVMNFRVFEAIGEPKTVTLLYDEATQSIGVRPVSPIMPNAYPVYNYAKRRHAWVRGNKFIKAAKLQFSYCVRFTDPYLEADTLILNLNHTARVIRKGD